jgi:DNA-binding winged helix-turn-helix (wHTH) protein
VQVSPARLHVRRAEFQVADWTIERALNRVSRAGKSVHLRPKLMDVLVFLSGRSGDVVSKEELLEAVWPHTFVEESALTHMSSTSRLVIESR